MRIKISNSYLELVKGDITQQDTDVVVNAANSRLAPGGGVAGAIHRAAGPALWQECKTLGGCATGQAKISKAHNLPNTYIIHTVGPVYSGASTDAQMLTSAYLESLKLADENNIHSIAFPAISTGAFGYPPEEAAGVALGAIASYLKGATNIELVRLVLYDGVSLALHQEMLPKITK